MATNTQEDSSTNSKKKKSADKQQESPSEEKTIEKAVRLTRDKQLMHSFDAIAGSIGKMNEMQEKIWKEEREEIAQERLAAAERFKREQEVRDKEREVEREEKAKDRECEKEKHSVMVSALKDVLTAAFSSGKP